MGEKVEHILYSLLPLILIIFVSWFFSFLGSRVKKQTDQAHLPQRTEPEKGADFVFLDEDDTVEQRKPAQYFPGMPLPTTGPANTLPQQPSSPPVSPKPIEPKWWGA